MHKSLYTLIQWTWGLPQTLIGSAVYLVHRKDTHFDHNGACVTVWDKDSGVSLGKFVFVPQKKHPPKKHIHKQADSEGEAAADRFLLEHEYGHTIQSLILGPAYLLLVGAPSMLWNRLPYFARKRAKSGTSYYAAPFEKSANVLGAKAAARKAKKTRAADPPSSTENIPEEK